MLGFFVFCILIARCACRDKGRRACGLLLAWGEGGAGGRRVIIGPGVRQRKCQCARKGACGRVVVYVFVYLLCNRSWRRVYLFVCYYLMARGGEWVKREVNIW